MFCSFVFNVLSSFVVPLFEDWVARVYGVEQRTDRLPDVVRASQTHRVNIDPGEWSIMYEGIN